MIKKFILASSLVFIATSSFAADTLCSNLGSAGSGTALTGNASKFVVTGFTPKCSANTEVVTDQNATAFWGAAASTKGKNYFGGHTAGGAVKPMGECTGGACATGTASGKLTEAAALGSGS